MANGGILDAGAGAAQSIGRYFSVISAVPSSLYVTFIYLLVASGSWQHSPDWQHAFGSLAHLGLGGIAFLALAGIGLGIFIHPIQFAVVQFFEGYWGPGPFAQTIRSQRIMRYQNLCEGLNRELDSIIDELAKGASPGTGITLAGTAPLRSRGDEAQRRRDAFPRNLNQVMPTRLGNVLRRAESLAGSQYEMNALQIVPHLLLIAPANHVDYVNDMRLQLDLAVRMTFISAIASVTAILFLWPYGLWALIAIIPYALAYLSYRGAIVAGTHYGSALSTLIDLDRFALYRQLHLQLPATTGKERDLNIQIQALLNYQKNVHMDYDHSGPDTGAGTTP